MVDGLVAQGQLNTTAASSSAARPGNGSVRVRRMQPAPPRQSAGGRPTYGHRPSTVIGTVASRTTPAVTRIACWRCGCSRGDGMTHLAAHHSLATHARPHPRDNWWRHRDRGKRWQVYILHFWLLENLFLVKQTLVHKCKI